MLCSCIPINMEVITYILDHSKDIAGLLIITFAGTVSIIKAIKSKY